MCFRTFETLELLIYKGFHCLMNNYRNVPFRDAKELFWDVQFGVQREGICRKRIVRQFDFDVEVHSDLILTKRLWSFFLTIFRALWPFSLHFICFPALFEGTVSIYSTPLCGWNCGQKTPRLLPEMVSRLGRGTFLYPCVSVCWWECRARQMISAVHSSGFAGL